MSKTRKPSPAKNKHSPKKTTAAPKRKRETLSLNDLAGIIGGSGVASGTGYSRDQQQIMYSSTSTAAQKKATDQQAKSTLAYNQAHPGAVIGQTFKDMGNFFGKVTGVTSIVNGIKDHNAVEAVTGFLSVGANVIPGVGTMLGAATKGASAVVQATVRGVQATGQIVKGAHQVASAASAVNTASKKARGG